MNVRALPAPLTWTRHRIGWITLLAGVTGLGVVLRLMALESRPLWLDEVGQVYAAQQPLGDMLYAVRSMAAGAPADFLGTRLALAIAPSYEYAARLWPLVVGSASIPLLFGAARAWTGQAGALAAAAVLAVLPFHVHYSTEARPYALAMAVTITALWAFRARRWGWLGAATAVAGLTYYPIALVLAGLAVVLLARHQWRGLVSIVGGGVAVLPWLVYAAGRGPGVSWTEAVPDLGSAAAVALLGLLGGLVVIVLPTAAVGAWRQRHDLAWVALTGVALVTIPATWGMAVVTGYYWDPRHVAPLLPVLLMLAAGALGGDLHDRHQRRA